MSHINIISHPFTLFSPVQLLIEGKSLPTEAKPLVIEYADAVTLVTPEQTVVAPRVSMTVLRGVGTSLTNLALNALPIIQQAIPNYSDQEHEVPAVLFLSMELVTRERAVSVPIIGTTAEAEEIAKKRGWKNVTDVTNGLLDMEDQLVTMGAAVLRHEPELQARFVEDDELRTYDDTFGDIQRRLDLMNRPEFSIHFAGVTAMSELAQEAETMCREAAVFRQSREGRLSDQVRMTFLRNVLFTVFLQSISELQTVLRASLSKRRPDLLERVDAKYWWNLARMSRSYSRPQALEPETTEPSETPADSETSDPS